MDLLYTRFRSFIEERAHESGRRNGTRGEAADLPVQISERAAANT